jgi:hypothetical protein
MNKFAVLAASLVASFALAFAVYSAENRPNTSGFPRVVASVRLTNQTQQIPTTTILNAPRTGLYRVSTYMAMTTPGLAQANWELNLSWTDEAGVESNLYTELGAKQIPPSDYAYPRFVPGITPPSLQIEAIAGTPINYVVGGSTFGDGGTYELFISVEQLQ